MLFGSALAGQRREAIKKAAPTSDGTAFLLAIRQKSRQRRAQQQAGQSSAKESAQQNGSKAGFVLLHSGIHGADVHRDLPAP